MSEDPITDCAVSYTARDIANLSRYEIEKIQHSIDKRNESIIREAFDKKEISAESCQYLLDNYQGAMDSYRAFYNGLYQMFGSPAAIHSFDCCTGEVEKVRDANGNLREKDYTLKEVTPFTSMRLKYISRNGNPVFVILPRMKDPRDAINKLKPGGRYYRAYNKEYTHYLEARRIYERSKANGYDAMPEPKAPKLPHERLKDVLRFTVTGTFYQDVERIVHLFEKSPKLGVDSSETRSSFYHLDLQHYVDKLVANEKSYYDTKLFCNVNLDDKMIKVEGQIKIKDLNDADFMTHPWYEEARRKKLQAETVSSAEEKARLLADAEKLSARTKKTYISMIDKYNNRVLRELVRRYEDDWQALARVPEKAAYDYRSGAKIGYRYLAGEDFLERNFMPRPFKALNLDKDFNEEEPQIKNAALRYYPILRKKYIVNQAEKRYDKAYKKDYVLAEMETCYPRDKEETLRRIAEYKNSFWKREILKKYPEALCPARSHLAYMNINPDDREQSVSVNRQKKREINAQKIERHTINHIDLVTASR